MKTFRVIMQLNNPNGSSIQREKQFISSSIDDVWEYVKKSIPHNAKRIVIIDEENPSMIILKYENLPV